MRRPWRGREADRGSATVWVLGVVALLGVVCAGVLAMGQAVLARHRAGAGADLAALAAATEWTRGERAACGRAAEVARAQGVRVVRCAVRGEVADVSVAAGAGPYEAVVRARAGPGGPDSGRPASASASVSAWVPVAEPARGPVLASVRDLGSASVGGPVRDLGSASARGPALASVRGLGSAAARDLGFASAQVPARVSVQGTVLGSAGAGAVLAARVSVPASDRPRTPGRGAVRAAFGERHPRPALSPKRRLRGLERFCAGGGWWLDA